MPLDIPPHPQYLASFRDWQKFQLTMKGGQSFIEAALKKFSEKEPDTSLRRRRDIAYVPAYAKAAILEIRNSIFGRLHDVRRIGGTDSYQQAINGKGPGVDGEGTNMNKMMGMSVLQELLSMGAVGVYVDRAKVETVRDARQNWPYLYKYGAMDIWNHHFDRRHNLRTLVLIDTIEHLNPDGFVDGYDRVLRVLRLQSNGDVEVEFQPFPGLSMNLTHMGLSLTTSTGVQEIIPKTKNEALEDPVTLKRFGQLPFYLFKIDNSLLQDIADHQIAMLNLGSSDINYAIKANIPFYTEQRDFAAEQGGLHLKTVDENKSDVPPSEDDAVQQTGTATGRYYGKDLERPDFISPPTENLTASRAFTNDLKEEVRHLVGLSLSNIRPQRESAESKQEDRATREDALAAISQILQDGEQAIGEIWSLYENKRNLPLKIVYPTDFKAITDHDRIDLSKSMREEMDKVPSMVYQKEVAKKIARTMVGRDISEDDLTKIFTEIDQAPVVQADAETIKMDIETGLVGNKTASKIRGYPEGEVEAATKDHAEKLKRIAESQAPAAAPGLQDPGARGVKDLATNSDDAKNEKARLAQEGKGNTGPQD